jgi:hypothetical protein
VDAATIADHQGRNSYNFMTSDVSLTCLFI